MTELANDSTAVEALELLDHYSFDLGGYAAEQLVRYWQRDYPILWVRAAIIEALYQGRYKAISVEQILVLWKRRKQMIYHYNLEFERIICGKFPKSLASPPPLPPGSRTIELSETESTVVPPPPPVVESAALTTAPPAAPANADAASSTQTMGDRISAEEKITPAVPVTSTPEDANAPSLLFRPVWSVESGAKGTVTWTKEEIVKHPIDQFVPQANADSSFYLKLRAVATQDEDPEESPDPVGANTDAGRTTRRSPP